MDNFLLAGIVVTFLAFITGLGLKNTNSNKKSLKMHRFYNRLVTISIILFFIFIILWQVV
jgi:hypothetical protein